MTLHDTIEQERTRWDGKAADWLLTALEGFTPPSGVCVEPRDEDTIRVFCCDERGVLLPLSRLGVATCRFIEHALRSPDAAGLSYVPEYAETPRTQFKKRTGVQA